MSSRLKLFNVVFMFKYGSHFNVFRFLIKCFVFNYVSLLNVVSYLIMSFKCRVCVLNFVSYLIMFHYFKSFRVPLFFIFKLFCVKVSSHVRYHFMSF